LCVEAHASEYFGELILLHHDFDEASLGVPDVEARHSRAENSWHLVRVE
jgi:hypothetical protein